MRGAGIGKILPLLPALIALSSCADSYHRYDHAAAAPSSSAAHGDAWGSESPRRVYYYPARSPGHATAK